MQLPLRDGDTVSLRRRGHLNGPAIPAEVVINLVAYHFYGLEIQDRLRQAVTSRKPPALMSRGPVPLDVQEARRVRRRGKRA